MIAKGYLRDRISQQIAHDIIAGRIFPGEKLTEISLCTRFQVSRTPVREALMILEKQGFVDNSKNSGATVRKITEDKIIEIEDIYAVLEGRALELAVINGKILENDIAQVTRLEDEMERCVAQGGFREYMERNILFHNVLMKKCPNDELRKTLKELNERIRFYRRGGIPTQAADLARLLEAHRNIIEALRNKDAFQARCLLERHVREGRRTLSSQDMEKMLVQYLHRKLDGLGAQSRRRRV